MPYRNVAFAQRFQDFVGEHFAYQPQILVVSEQSVVVYDYTGALLPAMLQGV